MKTPDAALDALTQPKAITLGQAALLEKIASPLVVACEVEPAAYDLIPSLYLLSLPAREGAAHLATLLPDAFAWADTLSPEQYQAAVREAGEAVRAFYELLPSPEAGSKKASPVTVG